MSRWKLLPRTGEANVTAPSAPTFASAPFSRTSVGARATNGGATSRSRRTVTGRRVVHDSAAGCPGIHWPTQAVAGSPSNADDAR
jgi:hypothetical protein